MDDQNQQPAENQAVDASVVAPEEQVMQIGKYSIKIVKSACIGAASCVAVSPAVFKMNEENIAIFLDGATDEESNILAAAQSCPTKAIFITDTDTSQQVWPA